MNNYVPKTGDSVEFWSEEAQLWEPGTVRSTSAQNRIAIIDPDDTDSEIALVEWTCTRPVSATDDTAATSSNADIPSFWEAAKTFCRTARVSCDLANSLQAQIDAAPYSTGYPVGDKVAARLAEYRERTHAAEDRADRLAEILDKTITERDAMTRRAISAEDRAEELENDRDGWAKEANDNLYISRMGYEERDQARARVKELEYQNRVLKSDLDVAETEAKIQVKRTEKAEADRDELRQAWLDAEKRVEELKHEIQVETHRRLEWMKLAHAAQSREADPEAKAVIDGDGDRWELNHGTGLYENGSFNQTLDTIEKVWGIKERIY